ncbi:MAG TPA: SGNH/GDSL hydrolase family protein [Acidimicrobiales bacterium]|nr:SGNH/GDSL hydrolase family protein [Acidimicrobiales bacterium]
MTMGRQWRRLAIALLALPLLAATVVAVEVMLARRGTRSGDPPLVLAGPVGQGPGPPLEVVWLGDSTAAGIGAPDRETTLPIQVSLGLGRPVELTVLARGGATVSDVVERQLPALAGRQPDAVFISAGANDVTHLRSRSDLARDYRRLLAGLGQSSEVIVLGIPDMGSIPRLAQPLRALAGWRGRQLDRVVRQAAAAGGAAYVDIAGETGPDFRGDPERFFAADRYHPSAAGYRRWADAVLDVVGASTRLGR